MQPIIDASINKSMTFFKLKLIINLKGNPMKKMIGTLLVLCTIGANAQSTQRTASYMPEGGYASTIKSEFIKPSLQKQLQVDQKIENLTKRNFAGETTVQRLTVRSYWVQTGFYNTVFYVGHQGVLVMDPIGYGSSVSVLKAIKSITDKPVTAVIYSHHHEDHIGDIGLYIEQAKKVSVNLRIIATYATAAAMRAGGSELPQPTEKLNFLSDSTTFEDLTIKVEGFATAAHSSDAAVWLLEQEKIVHIPDLLNPNQLPYLGFGGSETYVGYKENLQALDKMQWKYLSAGHGNIGSHGDVKFMLNYLDDLESAIQVASKASPFEDFSIAKFNNHQAAAHEMQESIINKAMDSLRGKYGEFYGFEASVPYQIRMVLDSWG
jgi:glyoxylase-like metal-dependent hydrolase (beta-lactamase superfamily II)